MEKKFSKGKWRISNAGLFIESENGVIAAISLSAQENINNAKLIAAAPDLLHRLNSIVLSVKSHPDYVNGQEGDEWHDIVELAEQTIKKATE